MRLGDLSRTQLANRLGQRGIYLQTGPFLCHLRSPLPSVAEALHFGYADFSLVEDERFADFHVCVAPPRGLRRWVRPQVLFTVDGAVAFAPYPRRLAAPILEWGLNWCVAVRAHQYLMIHAAVLERHGQAVLLCGTSGVGKSTLCAAATLRGWRLLSDEITVIRPSDGQVLPLPRPVSLKNESIQVIRQFAPEASMGPEWTDTAKGTVAHLRPPTASVLRSTEAARPGCVVFVNFQPHAPLSCLPVPKAVALMQLADNSFNYSMLGLQGFEQMSRLVEQCDCFSLSYGQLDAAVEQLNALVNVKETLGGQLAKPQEVFTERTGPLVPGGTPIAELSGLTEGGKLRPLPLETLAGPPERWASLDVASWDALLRQARRAEVLPRLAVLVAESGCLETLPAKVQEHLRAALAVARKHAATIRWELQCIGRALAGLDVPVVLLKGAAYLAAGLPPARGRVSSDVDLMVPKAELVRVEAALVAQGWRGVKLHPYDQRYYRQWMHELPPLEHEVRRTVVDLHHTILPETSRLHPDAEKLLAASQPLPDSFYRVLAPEDMVLHSAAHLLQDDDFSGGVRGLLDLDDLLRHFGRDDAFWQHLVPRARELELGRPLYYALRFTQAFLDTPVPAFVQIEAANDAPTQPVRAMMDRLVTRALQPRDLEELGASTAMARWLLYVRAHWLRMPPLRLTCHLTHKALRRWHDESEPDAPPVNG